MGQPNFRASSPLTFESSIRCYQLILSLIIHTRQLSQPPQPPPTNTSNFTVSSSKYHQNALLIRRRCLRWPCRRRSPIRCLPCCPSQHPRCPGLPCLPCCSRLPCVPSRALHSRC